MSWPEFMAARQLLTEEGVGKAVRGAQAHEDEQFDKAVHLLKAAGA
jgi:hypothetical protein